MKKPIFVLIAFFLFSNTFSQTRISVAGGIHSTSVSPFLNIEPFTLSNAEVKRSSAHFGFFADVPVNDSKRLSFQPGILFFSRGTTQEQVRDTSLTNISRATTELKINYIDVPLNFVMKLPLKKNTKFILGVGPQASLFYSGSAGFSTFDTFKVFKSDQNKDLPVGKNEGQFRVVHFGLDALLGFEFKKAYLTANYNKSLSSFYESSTDYKYTSIGATLGIYLGKTASTKKMVDVIDNDRDKDGIVNIEDQCPDLAGSRIAKGCPDKDADGIQDALDKCPDVTGPAANHGCPILDRDNDGVTDEYDQCPDRAGNVKYNGCPIPDADGDGVNDEEDLCINEVGTKANSGCPEIKKDVIEKINYAARQISFQHRSDVLTPSSIKVLNEIIALLLKTPGLKITVEGHSSLDGPAEANLILSQKRADRVKEYMILKGINKNKITAIGYGYSRPLSNEKTEVANKLNRRVEIKLSR